MRKRGIHLQYSFDARGQRGAELQNPLFDLLQAVLQHGSISGAAQGTGASYRHVWGQLKAWEDVLGEPLVSWVKGQRARLTPFAERLVWAERRARTRLTPHIETLRAELERVVAEALDGSQQVLTLFASHDLALPLLRERASAQHDLHIDLRFAGSIDALRALRAGRCLVAGFHVPTLPDHSPVFARAMKSLLQPGVHKLIGCTRRTQGLMVAKGNPHAIATPADLTRRPLRFVNRQPGSGTRLLMDHLLDQQRIDPAQVGGYLGHLEDSHVAVAASIASGLADVGPGIEAAARQFGLDFVPLLGEDYFLVCMKESLDHPAVQRLREVLAGEGWQRDVAVLPGYAPSRSGEVLAMTRALAWWHFRAPKKKPAPAAKPTKPAPVRRRKSVISAA
jgi:putative molybdopterin biosynthesis protein